MVTFPFSAGLPFTVILPLTFASMFETDDEIEGEFDPQPLRHGSKIVTIPAAIHVGFRINALPHVLCHQGEGPPTRSYIKAELPGPEALRFAPVLGIIDGSESADFGYDRRGHLRSGS
jgi:hypothetical protein